MHIKSRWEDQAHYVAFLRACIAFGHFRSMVRAMRKINTPAFALFGAGAASPVVFASPHSGRAYGACFAGQSVLPDDLLRSSEDVLVDRLLADVPALGAPLLTALAPRAYLDLNRCASELDPAVIAGLPPGRPNPRVTSGLGVIPRVVSGGRAIYHGKLNRAEAEARLEQIWHPYHAALSALLERVKARHGASILLDFHSMPHHALAPLPAPRPEIVLGDRFGRSAAPHIVAGVQAAFEAAGFRVARNAPFAGAYITRRYGRPAAGAHAVQIEIDRALYQDPGAPFAESGKLLAFRARLAPVLARLAQLGGASAAPLAAE